MGKTTDGYVVRLFVIAFTKRRQELVKKLIPESIGKEIEKQTQGIFPLKDVLIRKVKIIKKPKFDITKLMELHGDGDGDAGVEMLRPEAEDAVNTLSADIKAVAE